MVNIKHMVNILLFTGFHTCQVVISEPSTVPPWPPPVTSHRKNHWVATTLDFHQSATRPELEGQGPENKKNIVGWKHFSSFLVKTTST